MTEDQEDALYDFLENNRAPFTLDEVINFVRLIDFSKNNNLAAEIDSFIDSQNIAFRIRPEKWISRRGCFETLQFVINPTRPELLNGILVPGHRCVPFANPLLLPQEYLFYWKGTQIPFTTIEGPPEEFYPYYSIFGEEYAPQYVARDNPNNENAFNSDPYEDPPDVSIQVLDMRNLYRELSFVPGDRFVVRTVDWKTGAFELERVGKDQWSPDELSGWLDAAEKGFEQSFAILGPGTSTEEQIAYAYWHGGERMREVPAYALEDFLFEKTERIEITAYGIETRFWFAGKEIPDLHGLEGVLAAEDQKQTVFPAQNQLEKLLLQNGIPISEFVVQSYVWDTLYRRGTSGPAAHRAMGSGRPWEPDLPALINRIVPPSVMMDRSSQEYLIQYVLEALEEFERGYSPFKDTVIGPIRQRMGELHTAVIDLATRLCKGGIDTSWLPKHTFIVLSQIQNHAAGVLEDLDADIPPAEEDLSAMDNSLDSMIETYEDIKELIDEALNSFRRNNISVVRFSESETGGIEWQTFQISLGGTDIWRRVILPETCRLGELHGIIQALLGWNGGYVYQFTLEESIAQDSSRNFSRCLDLSVSLGALKLRNGTALVYEYGTKWIVKILLISRHDPEPGEHIRCLAGTGAAPPEYIDGPLRFRRYMAALENGASSERQMALRELGQDFDAGAFDLESCNRKLRAKQK